MYIPIGISSPVGKKAPAHIPETQQPPCSTHPAPSGRFHSVPEVGPLGSLLSGREDPGPHVQLDHMVSQLPPLPFSKVRLFFFFYGGNDCFRGLTHLSSCPGLPAKGQCPLQ